MKRISTALSCSIALYLSASTALSADQWIQIEAQPSLTQTTRSAQKYAANLPNVVGFDLPGRWNAIALGPYATEADADAARRGFLAQGLIPRDSYLTEGSNFRNPVWPVGASLATLSPSSAPNTDQAASQTAAPATPVVETEPAEAPDETVAQARKSERDLDRDARKVLQIALQFSGHYTSTIDGAFGAGTRRSMSAWQTDNGFESTGVLTTKQRAIAITARQSVIDSLGIRSVNDDVAGITINLPMNMTAFAQYTPPFARYDATNNSGVQVFLISQSGDDATLGGLYEIMQTLEIVPANGERSRDAKSFKLIGENANIISHTEAKLVNGAVKGWTLIWPTGDEQRRNIALNEMRSSFETTQGAVLPDAYGDGAEQDIDLMAGLRIRRPDAAGTGFFVDSKGAVLTSTDLVADCAQITLDETVEATVFATDNGLTILKPTDRVAPLGVAKFDSHLPRLQGQIATAGFAYGGRLGAATLNYGLMAEHRGLNGEDDLLRLDLSATAGEAGGPVFNMSGGVVGMLASKYNEDARSLPENVNFAYDMEKLTGFLSQNGVTVAASEATEALSFDQLIEHGRNVSTLVSCWN